MSLPLRHWVWVVLLLAASITLYNTSYRVQAQQERLAQIHTEQKAEKASLHVLEAEWAMLTAPARLQELSDKYLELKPVVVAQIVPKHRLERVLAMRAPAEQLALGEPTSNAQKLALSIAR